MFNFKFFNNFDTKKKIFLGTILISIILMIVSKNYIINEIKELARNPSIKTHLINIVKVAIPLKNLILMRDIDDRIALLKSSGSCDFCNLSKGNLEGSDLDGVSLRYANLSNVNLTNANLTNANLTNANLINANLTNANISRSDLFGTNLTNANLSGVNLTSTVLTGANIQVAIFVDANLSRLNLSGVDLSNKDLSGAILNFANLSGTNLNGVDLRNKDLTGVDLSGVDLSNQDLTGTILLHANLSDVNLTGVNLKSLDLTSINLSGVDLSNQDLTGTILTYANLTGANLSGVDLRNKDLTGANLSRIDLGNKDLTGTILTYANLTGANLSGVDLTNKDLMSINLSEVDLSNQDLTGTILTYANLTGANLSGVDLRNKDLTGVNLSGVDLSNHNLSGTILKDANKIKINVKKSTNPNWSKMISEQNLNITRYDLNDKVQYIATQDGSLFEIKNNELKLILDLKNDSRLNGAFYQGIFGVASKNDLVYVSYIMQDSNDFNSLVVDEYSMNFSKVRNIIKIGGLVGHYGGTLMLDSLGKLYVSVGDGSKPADFENTLPQDLNSLRGKILRLDVSESRLEPEIIAYGIREPWGVTIDSKDRMFLLQCGEQNVEGVYFLNDLYSDVKPNFGWPVFEGSIRMKNDSLKFSDISAPIFETKVRPGCLTAGIYLDDMDVFLFGDYFGTIRLLKQKDNGDWYLLNEYKQNNVIYGFGRDEKTNKILIAPNNLELEVLVSQVKSN
jgi:uncharacterized protein YjbI with pentapeptide repeats